MMHLMGDLVNERVAVFHIVIECVAAGRLFQPQAADRQFD